MQGTARALGLCALCLAGTALAERVPIGRYVELRDLRAAYGTSAGDPQRTARSRLLAPQREPERLWSTALPLQKRIVPPLVLEGGTLIVGGSAGVHALDAQSGAPRWFAPIGHVRFTPSLTQEGSIVAAASGRLFVLAVADGAVRELPLPFEAAGATLVLDGGEIVLGGRDGRVYAVGLDGALLGSLPARAALWTARIGPERVVSAGRNATLTLLAPQAAELREVQLSERLVASPIAAGDGLIWALGERGTLWQVGAHGELREGGRLGETGISGAPALGWDGGLRVGLRHGEVIGLDVLGREVWRRGVDSPPGPIVIDAEDTALLVSARGTLYAMDRKGELRYRRSLDSGATGRPVVGPDQTLYMIFRSGRIEAFK